MDPDDLRDVCLALPATSETFPFGPDTPVYKTTANNKVFAIMSTPGDPNPLVTLKCVPEDGASLCEQYDSITPGYHMNKKHWLTVRLTAEVPDSLVTELVTESYRLVRPRPPRARASDS
ncbi:MmcQ/YjbR family DNA-binding protein [Glaciihabitans sp. dw_435]|uniref:MmcQ/YjbR family DNA-binding protein n=1 Tax=Glaciihabitans sp. dw_435 TaxID=2720081 RepID=UPI001BD5B38C|nr:MmcQ/YjbR family DNA-binding protein [Glaciihabitans sp. dw_435]